jgi:hypothetical protein
VLASRLALGAGDRQRYCNRNLPGSAVKSRRSRRSLQSMLLK